MQALFIAICNLHGYYINGNIEFCKQKFLQSLSVDSMLGPSPVKI